MNTRFVQGLFSIPVATALLLAGCFSGEKNPCGYPTAPQGVTVLSYVSATCAEETSDGSKDLPFATINEAISALNGPGAILIGSGNADGNRHTHTDLPILMVGSAGGAFNTSRFVDYQGVPLANLYLKMTQTLGIEGVDQFGDSNGVLGDV